MVEVDVAGGNVTATAFYKPGSSVREQYPQSGDDIASNDATVFLSVNGQSMDGSQATTATTQASTAAATGSASATDTTQASTTDTTQASTESKYSIDSSKPIEIDNQSNPISQASATQLNHILFPTDESKRDHFLLIGYDGKMKIVKKPDMSNPIDPDTKISDKDYVTRAEIHIPVNDKIPIQYGENGPTFTISKVEPGNFTYMYTLKKGDGTDIKEPFSFFDIFPLTPSVPNSGASRRDTDESSSATLMSELTPGGQLKRRIRRRVTRRRSNRRRRVQRRNTVNKR